MQALIAASLGKKQNHKVAVTGISEYLYPVTAALLVPSPPS